VRTKRKRIEPLPLFFAGTPIGRISRKILQGIELEMSKFIFQAVASAGFINKP
jgi:hypothetical protein